MVAFGVHKTLIYIVLIFIAGGLLGVVKFDEKVFNLVAWKTLFFIGIVYVAWAVNRLIHF